MTIGKKKKKRRRRRRRRNKQKKKKKKYLNTIKKDNRSNYEMYLYMITKSSLIL